MIVIADASLLHSLVLQATTFYAPPELFEVILARDTERKRRQNES